MAEFKIIYGRGRFPIRQRREDGSWGCRGCGSAIPKGRRTWCSNQCSATYNPSEVLEAVKKRDKGICAVCGVDCFKARREWKASMPEGYRAWSTRPVDIEWRKNNPDPGKPEYDHIVEFAEGGLTVLENMQTLCRKHHLAKSKAYAAKRAAKNKLLRHTQALA